MNSSMSGVDYSFRKLMESISLPAYMFNRDGEIFWYNAAAVQLWGRHPDPARDRWCGFQTIYWADGTRMLPEELPPRRIMQGRCIHQGIEIMADRVDGNRVNVVPHLMALHDAQGETAGGVNIQMDITACRQIEVALNRREAEFRCGGQLESLVSISRDISTIKETEQQLRYLVAQRDAIVEVERKRIAQEIHDELGQLLNTLHISNASMRAMLPRESAALREKSDALADLIRRCIDVARNVATCLRPAALDAGIVCGLEWLVREFGEHTEIECVLRVEPPDLEPDLKEEQAVALFRIAQESMTNVVRHASASRLTVRLSGTSHEIRLEVRDDGSGFDATATTRLSSLGLLGMRERALAMGGRLDVNSHPGQGTLVRVALALSNMSEAVND